jgi:molybdopterin/thiamine biosynthesis adenylyltransferase
MPLSSDQRERYSRQIELQGWGESGQERLLASRVFIAGAGGLGCAAAVYLAAAGVGDLTICDSDSVELSNLNRQILYDSGDLAAPKASAAARRLAALNADIRVTPVLASIDSDSAPGLVLGADLVLDCLDSRDARVALNRACIASSTPMVHAAVSDYTGYLSFLHPPATPCLECLMGGAPTAAAPPVPGVTSGVVGTLEAMEALKFLTGTGEVLAGRLLVMEGIEPRFDVIVVEPDPSCPACSDLG